MSQVYFVCATPGASGNFLITLIRSLFLVTDTRLQPTFLSTTPDPITRDFWFDNVDIGDATVVHVPFRPDYEKLKTRFPGCKIIVLTHTLPECNTIAMNLWEGFYKAAYEFGAEPFFRHVLETHSHLFSSTTLTPDQLTPIEANTFIKILSYQKLLDGFFCLDIPDDSDIIELTHRDLYINPAHFRTQLESFTGRVFDEHLIDAHNQTTANYIENFFRTANGENLKVLTA
jgi:hypothetical protein